DGGEHFNQTFFDNARAKLSDVIGGVDNGWKVAQSTLGSERLWAGSPRHALKYLGLLERAARAVGRENDPAYLDRHAQLVLDIEDLTSTYRRSVTTIGAGQSYGFEASVLKIYQTELSQRIMQYAMEIIADTGGLS